MPLSCQQCSCFLKRHASMRGIVHYDDLVIEYTTLGVLGVKNLSPLIARDEFQIGGADIF